MRYQIFSIFVALVLLCSMQAQAQPQSQKIIRELAHTTAYGMDTRCGCPQNKNLMPKYERCMHSVKSRMPVTFSLPLRFLQIPQTQYRAFLEEQSYLQIESCRNGTVTHDVLTSDAKVIRGETNGTTPAGTYNFTVSALAELGRISLGSDRFFSESAAIDPTLSAPANVTLQIGSADYYRARVDIQVTAATTITDFANAINTGTSRAKAIVINAGTVSSPDYQITIFSLQGGSLAGSLALTLDPVLIANNAIEVKQALAAQDAVFSIAGMGTFSRGANRISDVIPGLTFEFFSVGSASLRVR